MSIYRSYFSKNNTIISNNETNSARNPVCDISYGTLNKQVSRFIFDIDLTNLKNKIDEGYIYPLQIKKHILHLTNTINYTPEYLGKKSYLESINRASGFDLELFNITEEWDEGTGYDIIYDDITASNSLPRTSNWFNAKNNTAWNVEGIYDSGTTQIVGTQRFELGNENIEIDITDYINYRLFGIDYTGITGITGYTGFTGITGFTGASFGLGIKFTDEYEELITELREAVSFHTKYTNTWYEPYVETIFDDTIIDDRDYFYMDKDNSLFLYLNKEINPNEVIINSVDIYDYNGIMLESITGDSIHHVTRGVYKIIYNVSSIDYPDAVLFNDVWNLTINGVSLTKRESFYLILRDNFYFFTSNKFYSENYCFYYWGIKENEKIFAGSIRTINLSVKELYPNQDNNIPLDLEYTLMMKQSNDYWIEVIPYTKINRTNDRFYFDIDTSWLIPQDYKLQIRMKINNYYENKETLSFSIVSKNLI